MGNGFEVLDVFHAALVVDAVSIVAVVGDDVIVDGGVVVAGAVLFGNVLASLKRSKLVPQHFFCLIKGRAVLTVGDYHLPT
jgi:hypothetical protein